MMSCPSRGTNNTLRPCLPATCFCYHCPKKRRKKTCRPPVLIQGGEHSYGHCKGKVLASLACAKEKRVTEKKSDVLQGTLDLMILKTLHAMGPLHGFGIARRIEQLSEDVLQLNEGTVY